MIIQYQSYIISIVIHFFKEISIYTTTSLQTAYHAPTIPAMGMSIPVV